MREKRTWTKPELTTYGKVEDITRLGTSPNRDLPLGNNNTAFPPS
jgi:hypothetical protein